jgi:hypothetical protein
VVGGALARHPVFSRSNATVLNAYQVWQVTSDGTAKGVLVTLTKQGIGGGDWDRSCCTDSFFQLVALWSCLDLRLSNRRPYFAAGHLLDEGLELVGKSRSSMRRGALTCTRFWPGSCMRNKRSWLLKRSKVGRSLLRVNVLCALNELLPALLPSAVALGGSTAGDRPFKAATKGDHGPLSGRSRWQLELAISQNNDARLTIHKEARNLVFANIAGRRLHRPTTGPRDALSHFTTVSDSSSLSSILTNAIVVHCVGTRASSIGGMR